MATLGSFDEGLHNVLFTLKSNEPLNPATVTLTVQDAAGFVVEVPMGPGTDETVFLGTWFTEGREPGKASVVASGEDLAGNLSVAEGEVILTSTYGRNYGKDYGDGL